LIWWGKNMLEAIIEHSREDVRESAMSVGEGLRAEGWKKGREEGEAVGREEGRIEGQAELLFRLLEHRFGPLPLHVGGRVLDAPPRKLDKWALRVLTAASLDEVLGP
jgi:hypothetical protein